MTFLQWVCYNDINSIKSESATIIFTSHSESATMTLSTSHSESAIMTLSISHSEFATIDINQHIKSIDNTNSLNELRFVRDDTRQQSNYIASSQDSQEAKAWITRHNAKDLKHLQRYVSDLFLTRFDEAKHEVWQRDDAFDIYYNASSLTSSPRRSSIFERRGYCHGFRSATSTRCWSRHFYSIETSAVRVLLYDIESFASLSHLIASILVYLQY